MTPPQLQLPTIRVSNIEILHDWDLENVIAIGDSIPGFRSGSSEFTFHLFPSDIVFDPSDPLNFIVVDKHQLSFQTCAPTSTSPPTFPL